MKLTTSSNAKKKRKDDMRSPVKTADDSMREALKRILRKGTEPRTVKIPEILAMDNEVRKQYGLRPLAKYPVILEEYKPTTQESTWMKLVGARITRKEGKLPTITPVYEEAEGVDPADNMEEINAIVEQRCKELFPTAIIVDVDQKKAVRESVIQQMEVRLAGEEIVDKPEPMEEDDIPEEDLPEDPPAQTAGAIPKKTVKSKTKAKPKPAPEGDDEK